MVANYWSKEDADKVGMIRKALICNQQVLRLVPYVFLSRLPAGDKDVASALFQRLGAFQTLLCFHGRMVASRFQRERHYHGCRFSHSSAFRL